MAQRLDIAAVGRGLFPSRAKAQEAIREGIVFVDGQRCERPGHKVLDDATIELRGRACPYVSRGGLKLEGAIEAFGIDLAGRTMLDIGSSTGGFTDCALQHGAARVIAVDVGTNQMVEPLRSDPRVALFERSDFRTMPAEAFEEADVAAMDVSFVSATLMAPAIGAIKTVREVVCLVKPQFECGAAAARAHKGVILDEALRKEAVEKVVGAFAEEGFSLGGVTPSPITGGDGNVEFLAHFTR